MSVRDLLSSTGSSSEKLYVDDVFSTYLYSGNGSTQTINNGIDLAGKGGMVWIKQRTNNSEGNTYRVRHKLTDTVRGATNTLCTDGTDANISVDVVSSFNSNGFTAGTSMAVAMPGDNQATWTFRKAPKFFDVVTFTTPGTPATDFTVNHSLGITPGMVILKRTDVSENWVVLHRSLSNPARFSMGLNTASAETLMASVDAYAPSATNIQLRTSSSVSTGGTYVAYLFAHDPSPDGITQCGSYIGNGSSVGQVVNLGWEPQFLLIKNSTGTGNWQVIDHMRGMPVGSADAVLQLNLANSETPEGYISPTATGFQLTSNSSEVNTTGQRYIYMAIRRPNKPPTSGTEVYKPILTNGTGTPISVSGLGFAPDLLISDNRSFGFGTGSSFVDKLRGKSTYLASASLGIESNVVDGLTSFDSDGVSFGSDTAYGNFNLTGGYIHHLFRRAPGFFDVVCWTGNGLGILVEIPHSLGVKPELIITKARNASYSWAVADAYVCHQLSINLASSGNMSGGLGSYSSQSMFNTAWAASASAQYNDSGVDYVSYLFATLPGISKVGNYIGNGSSQTINCGFTTGARFILIKRVDSTGDWYVWDSARGIVAANDPHLSLNTAATEVTTDDSVDPDVSGFIVNQNTATNINVSGGTYIFLAIS